LVDLETKIQELLTKQSAEVRELEQLKNRFNSMNEKMGSQAINLVISFKPDIKDLVKHLKIMNATTGYVASALLLHQLALFGELDHEELKDAYEACTKSKDFIPSPSSV
jgi:hypothetical protein